MTGEGYSRHAAAVNPRPVAYTHEVDRDPGQMLHDLRQAELFTLLDEEQLAKVAATARPLELPAGRTLFLRGDTASAFYLLAEGRVKVFKLLQDGRSATIRHVSPHQTFAEAALFQDTYLSGAETMTAARLYRFETRAFLDLLLAEPRLSVNLLGAMAELLALLNRRVEELLLPVPARLARYLLVLADQQPETAPLVTLSTSKRELAARLGTVPETLSRTFDRMKRGGILRMDAGPEQIELLDLERLRRLAQD